MKYLIPLLILFVSCSGEQDTSISLSDDATVISEVNIVDVRDGSIHSDMHVVVDSGIITAILDESSSWPDKTKVIEGDGKYITPGLAEMHAHIPSPNEGEDWIEDVLFLYLANGVTTIRGMLGHPRHLELRQEAQENSILSPRIYTSSTSFNGNSVPTVEAGRQKVRDSKEAGYDFLKFHPGIKRDVHDEIIRTANEVNIPYAGHVSRDVGIRHALESNYATVDHVDGYLEGLVPKSAGVDPNDNGFFGYNFTHLADPSMIDELVRMSKEHQVWVVPTQALFERWFSALPTTDLASAPEMKYMPASTIKSWTNRKNDITDGSRFNAETWNRFNEIRRELILKLHQDGQGLLLGSDAPQVFNVPGFAIHHELQYMLDAGLTPLEALQIGTINPAVFFGEEGNYGEIIEGASADFIMTDKNPLKDLSNLQHPDGVMVRGRWLSRDEMDKKLADLAARNQDR
ncbi:amidohydrolase family protein [Membranicola marinus]|uniref:Amidohydrolase family protein n=1 Tax=Membranihabitans marinus TaxID=1227546 RepID=A0A953HPJ3_9BACT|nr:amidohydrolase family protein [Membranihabitans marinus]MBY5958448.1 amidohydrolase family protein [Membranihabitans marinus]